VPVGEEIGSSRGKLEQLPAPPLAPAETLPGSIDKSELTIGEPKRLRDKEHLKFVAAQPCLVCGRQPCDPHHLRFAQPRAMGLKVSDEFTVPLCRGHHGSCIRQAMKRPGGKISESIRWRPPEAFGFKLILRRLTSQYPGLQ